MIKPLLITLLLVIITPVISTAQTISKDSLQQIARADARHFKLTSPEFKVFRKNKYNSGSDYFKPVKGNVRDTTFLRDSVYTEAFRYAAWQKTKKRHTTGHWVLIGGAIYIGVTIIVTAIVVGSQLNHFN